jgi:hypothetical protein
MDNIENIRGTLRVVHHRALVLARLAPVDYVLLPPL